MNLKQRLENLEKKAGTEEEPNKTIVLTKKEYARYKKEGVKALQGIKCLFIKGNEAYEEIKEDLGEVSILQVISEKTREMMLYILTGKGT